jgi:hypothetical protein
MTKISKTLLLFFSIVMAAIYFVSCTKHSYLDVIDIPETASFSKEVQPIFNAKCVSCHGGSTSPDLRAGNSYKALKEGGYATMPAQESKLFTFGFSGDHAAYSTSQEKGIILAWIIDGAEDN